jgi:lipopolysaccharide transport system ATP-binding protein
LSKIIEVRGLSKSYLINHEGKESYTALRDVIAHKAKKIFSFPNWKSTHKTQEEFWALKDVDFDIEQGDRVGIIGRNGAGKSTLLKILSRITEPTNGTIKLNGRIASLLEVGTGFHPELSGRENIFLNGAILGMSRAEIKKHFDAIVDFAEVEKFLDTPVKRYSSGMYVRLAFAVAAHLDPEILIIDEVLAVGDAQFQKKCLGKMEDVSKNEGRTLLFVSHNSNMLSNLCNLGFLLNNGNLNAVGNISKILDLYNNNNKGIETFLIGNEKPLFDCENFTLSKFGILTLEGKNVERLFDARNHKQFILIISGNIKKSDERLSFGFDCINEKGDQLFYIMHTDQPYENWPLISLGKFEIKILFDIDYLNEGGYQLNFQASLHGHKMLVSTSNGITIGFEKIGNSSRSPYWQGKKNTIIAPIARLI